MYIFMSYAVSKEHESDITSHRSFVLVSDRPHANRIPLSDPDPVPPPLCTFSGEFLRAGRPYESPKVGGNAFACLAQSSGAVKEMMEASVYNELVSETFRRLGRAATSSVPLNRTFRVRKYGTSLRP